MMCTRRIFRHDCCIAILFLSILSGCSFALKPTLQEEASSEENDSLTSDDEVDEPPSQEELAQEAELALNMFLRDQKVLFAKGQSEFELGLQATIDTQNNVRLGETIVPTISRNLSSLSFQARYAVTDNLEVSVKLPFTFIRTEVDYAFVSAQEILQDSSESGVGDIETRLRYQLLRESGYQPDLALSLSYKADTADDGLGSGDQSIGIGATIVETIDPAVFFLQAQYVHAFAADGVNRGAQYSLQFGSGFSLNDRVGYSIRYGLSYAERTVVNDLAIRGTSQLAGSLIFGTTVQLSKYVFVEPSLSVGITDDAPDTGLSFRLTF